MTRASDRLEHEWLRGGADPMLRWLIPVVTVAVAVAAAAAAVLWLPNVIAQAVGVAAAAVVGVAGPVATLLWGEWARRSQNPTVQVRRVRTFESPLDLGVHPAATEPDGGRVSSYVPRDFDEQLRAALRRGGFVLLVGASTAGKTRSAYEAVRAELRRYHLVRPLRVASEGGDLSALIPIIASHRRCVVWLDDLEKYLGAGGLTIELKSMLLDAAKHVVLLGTMRTAEIDRFRQLAGSSSGNGDPRRREWQVIKNATRINVEPFWTAAELSRGARETADPRIHHAIEWASRGYKPTQTIAGVPELRESVQDARSTGEHPRGLALVDAAVAARRAGFRRPIPMTLLEEMHQPYLPRTGSVQQPPESPDSGWAFEVTTTGVTRLVSVDGGYLAHDYLVDAIELFPGDGMPEESWQALLGYATPNEAYDIGCAQYGEYAFDRAEEAFRGAAEQGVPFARYMLGVSLRESGRSAEAAVELRRVLEEQTASTGVQHPDALATRHHLAICQGESGAPADAVASLRQLLSDADTVLGSNHPDTLSIRHNYARWRGEAGDVAGAVAEFRQLVADVTRVLGNGDPTTLTAEASLARWLGEAGDATGAATALEEVLERRTRTLGPDHQDTLSARHNLAYWTGEAGDSERAWASLQELLPDAERVLGTEHPDTLTMRHSLARWTSDPDVALRQFRELLPDVERVLGPHHRETLTVRIGLACCTARCGNPRGAAAALKGLLEESARLLGRDHPDTLAVRHRLAVCLGESGDVDGAVEDLRALLDDRIRILGRDHPDTVAATRDLGCWQARSGGC